MHFLKNIVYISLLASISVLGQKANNQFIYDVIDKEMDSIVKLKLKQQNNYYEINESAILLDSTYRHLNGDVDYCEDFIKYFYEYDSFGRVIEFIYKYAEKENCEPYRRKRIFTYYGTKLIEENFYKYNANNDNWDNLIKDEYIYNDNDQLIELKKFIWNEVTIEWDFKTYYTYSFDNNNNLLEEIHYRWEEDINDWEAFYKLEYAYNINDDIIEFKKYFKSQDEQQFEWSEIKVNRYTYNSNNFLIENLYKSNWNNITMNWDFLLKKTFINNTSGNPAEELWELWDATSENWVNSRLYTNTYNINSDILERVLLNWVEDSWVNKTKITYNYTSSFYVSTELTQFWDTINENWVNDTRITNTYNEFDNIIERINELWYGDWYMDSTQNFEYDSNQFLVFESWFDQLGHAGYYNYYYSEYDITLNTSVFEFQNDISIYPNPTDNMFSINGVTEDIKIIVYNLNGKKIIETTMKNNIDVSNLNKGIYFVNIQNNSINQNLKLLKN